MSWRTTRVNWLGEEKATNSKKSTREGRKE